MKQFALLLMLGSLVAMGYVLQRNGFFNASTEQIPRSLEAPASRLETDSTMDVKDGRAAANAEPSDNQETATTPIAALQDSQDDAEDAQDGVEQKKTRGTTQISPDENVVISLPNNERIRGIENLGSADAKTSMEYDHAGTELILYAELLTDGISLEWNETQNNAFVSYVIVRSVSDENPYYPKTKAIAMLQNKSLTSYVDASANTGNDYFYRICYTRSNNERAVCGNILKIAY